MLAVGPILIFFLQIQPLIGPSLPEYPFISCFSCASEDYEPLFLRSNSPALFGRPTLFDRLCDSRLELAASLTSAPAGFSSSSSAASSPSLLVPCDSACITVLEPQFFGGVQNERRPFTFVRGCASDIFELAVATAGPEGLPTEIEFLHRAKACLEMPISQIWPQLGGAGSSNRELVRVCSCAADQCNTQDDLSTAALSGGGRRRTAMTMPIMLMMMSITIVFTFSIIAPVILHI